jgi:hypothetical protein
MGPPASKLRVLLLAGLLPGAGVASVDADDKPPPEWVAKLSPPAPGAFPPLRPLTATYTFGWSALKSGRAEAAFSQKGQQLILELKGGTIGAVRGLWRMDSTSTSTADAASLLAVRLEQVETYSDEKRTTIVDFGPEGAARTRTREPADKDSGKTKRFKFAPVHDLHSALLFIRSQPLQKGDKIRLVVYPAAQAYLAEVEVLGRETLSTAGKKWPAIKLNLKLQRIEKDFTLASHRKFKRATGWLSDDSDRLLLKIASEVMVGKVWMDLEKIEFPQPKPASAKTPPGSKPPATAKR